MLPTINVSPTVRKPISLNKRAIKKIYSPSSFTYINSTQSKRQTSESPHNKLSKKMSKKSKIFNISTKNNTSNNSNFYENLYYYPPHKKTFSYINNLSSEVNLIYSDFNFNKAPSLRQNFSGIKKIIQDKRSDKLKYLDNLFSMSIYGNKLSHSISAKNITSKENNTSNAVSINQKFSGNNSYGDLTFTPKEKMENLKSYKIIKDSNSDKKNDINYNKTLTSKEALTNINSPTTNQETIRLPGLSPKEEKNDVNCITTRYQKTNSFIIDLNTKKMNFDINDCIFENDGNIKNVSSYAKRILYMKIFLGFQKKTLSNFMDKNFYKLKKYINHIETYFQKYMNICKEYSYTYLSYIKFLRQKIIEMDDEEKSLTGKEMQLGFEVDNLLTANIRTQRELEKLIDMRNFLYIVRHKDEKIPNIYSTFYIESKRYLLAEFFIKVFWDYKNVAVTRYLLTIPEPKPNLTSKDSPEFIVEQFPPLIKNIENISNISSKDSINNNTNVFTSHEEFISILKFLEDQNRALLSISKKKFDTIENYKEILENIVPPENIEYAERMMKRIEIKEKELNKIKKKHLMLLQKYDFYNHMNSQENLFTRKSSKQKKEDEQKSSFQDLAYFQTINYNILIKKAKYPGLTFFRKLLKYYLSLIKLYSNELIYSKTHPEYLEDIISFSINAENNPKFTYFLNRYILKLLELYEYIYDYTYKKNQLYKLEEKNLIVMKKQKVIISDKRKLDNARTIRKFIDKKRFDNDKLLIEKWKVPAKYVGRRNYIGNYCGDLIRAKSKEIIIQKRKIVTKKYSLDDELEEFIEYEDN